MYAKPGVWQFSRLAFNDEILNHHLLRLWKKELCNQEISIPSASNPVQGKLLGLAKIDFQQRRCVHSENLNQCVTEDKGRR
jgi:hypothetical protein